MLFLMKHVAKSKAQAELSKLPFSKCPQWKWMSLFKITMKLVYNFYSSFKGSKYKVAAKFGQKIISVTKSTDVPFLSVV